MIRRIIALSGMLALTACSTYSLEELRHTTPQGSPFQNTLAKLYMDFAAQEEKEYDWQDSWYFADKGLLAIYGKDTAPENIANWNIPEEALPQLEKAQVDLARLLTTEKMARQPEDAAKAQFYFDCWVEQQEENWQHEDIEYCKGEYLRAISKLDSDAKPAKKKNAAKKPAAKKPMPVKHAEQIEEKKPVEEVVKHEESAPAPVAEQKKAEPEPAAVELKKEAAPEAPKAAAPTTTSFVAFFDSGQAALTPPAELVLSDVAKRLAGKDNYEVVLTNKAKKSDAALLKERVANITKRLAEVGVKSSSIKTEASASTSITHKVEIFIND